MDTKDSSQHTHRDILERAMAGTDRALWVRIREQARSWMRMKRLAYAATIAGVLLVVLAMVALIGLNGARAGREGWLARLFVPVLEKQIYGAPDPNTGFCPIRVEDGTWQMIEDNTDGVLIPYLPMDLPEGYVFIAGSIKQPDRDTIDMILRYEAAGRAFWIRYRYRYGACLDVTDADRANVAVWDGTEVFLWETPCKAAWREADIYTVISIEGDIGIAQMEDIFRSVQANYFHEMPEG